MELNILKSLNLRHAIDNTISCIKQLGDVNICVIVPDKLSATMERILFEKLDIDSTFNIDVCTLNRLSRNILAETKAKYTTISKVGGIILLKKVLNDNNELIKSFQSSRHSYQYSNEIYKTLAQLKACQLTSEELIRYNCENEQLQHKINDLGTIMERYDAGKTGLLDNSDTLGLTSMVLDKSDTVKETYYIFLGFVDFTSQGFNLIERLMINAKGVYVNAYTSTAFNNSIYYKDVLYRLNSICDTIGAKVNVLSYDYNDDNLHKYLTNNLFAFNNLNFNLKNGDEITLYQAQNMEDEMEFIARDIRKKILSGDRYKKFGVGVYNLEAHVDTIKKVFNKYDLCYYIDVQKSFSSTCVYRFFINLWQLYLKNYDTVNLIEFISSSFINVAPNHKQMIIQLIKSINYRGDLTNLETEAEELKLEINSLAEIIKRYKLSSSDTIEQVIDKHNQIIQELNIIDQVNSMVENLNDGYDKKILAQSIKSSNQLLNEILEFYPQSTLADIVEIYEQAGMEQKISPLPLSADCIQFVPAEEIFTPFDYLYLSNCSLSTAPAIMQDVGILLDKELTYVQLSHNIEPTIARINRLNKFKLFNSALMFNEALCVCMHLGSPSELSPLVQELKKRIFLSNNDQDEENIDYVKPNVTSTDEAYLPLSLWDLVEFAYINNVECDKEVENILNSTSISPRPTNIKVDEQYLNFKEISASALENYFQCPLKFFFSYILKLKQPQSADVEMVDIGNILHELAYKYYLAKDRKNIDIKDFCIKTINQIIEKDKKLRFQANNPILINLIEEGERLIEYLRRMDDNSLFEPKYFEREFGEGKYFNALPLTDEVSLKGKIDRVDIYHPQCDESDLNEDYFRIIDYKSGNSDASFAELYYGKKIQLFLYALAIEHNTGKKASGMFYLPIKNILGKADSDDNAYKLSGFYGDDARLANVYDKNLSPGGKSEFLAMTLKQDGQFSKQSDKVLSESEMSNLMQYAYDLTAGAINEIKQGDFTASPLMINEMQTACTYCPYLSLCCKQCNNVKFRQTGKVNKDSFKGGNDETAIC